MEIELTEAQVKSACEEYLEILKAQGKLIYFRLNAGSFILSNPDGSYRRRVKGAGKGTADLIVIQSGHVQTFYRGEAKGYQYPIGRVTFIECKSSKGKTTTEQDEFAEMVRQCNCRYFVVRDVEELMEILK